MNLVWVGKGQLRLVITHLLQAWDAELVHSGLQLLNKVPRNVTLFSKINKAVLPA